MRKLSLLIVLILFSKITIGQTVETIYLSPEDSSKNYYIIYYPSTQLLNGYMFLIQGMFQKAENLSVQTELPKYAAQQGILTIIPVFKTGIASMGFDSATQASFLEILNHAIKKHHLANKKFYVGGFSIGGTCALKYAELSLRNNYPVKPAAVFALDSPLDFERMYNAMMREKRLISDGSEPQAEGEYLFKRFKKDFGKTPEESLKNCFNASPYSFSDTTQYAIKPLVNLPIRFYTEPDILWWLNDGADYSGMNAFDFAAITNELKRLGNKKVELIPTDNKGFRKPGNEKHPHSWSIAEPKDLVKWLLAQ